MTERAPDDVNALEPEALPLASDSVPQADTTDNVAWASNEGGVESVLEADVSTWASDRGQVEELGKALRDAE